MPATRTYDRAHRTELAERVEYELWLLEHYRTRFFHQGETPNGVTTFTIGDMDKAGHLRAHKQKQFADSFSEPAVVEALAPFGVLAFTSAFKLQDMIAEWILVANGGNPGELWRFSDKLKKHGQLNRAGALNEPPEFRLIPNLSHAFWTLYTQLESHRGAIIHGGKLELGPAGQMRTEDRHGRTLELSIAQQAAYIRFACLLSSILAGALTPTAFHQAVIEGDLATLAPLHAVAFAKRRVRLEAVRVHVPAAQAGQTKPYQSVIDLTPIRAHMEAASPVGPAEQLLLTFEIVAETEDRELVWRLPPEMVPDHQLELREDDTSLLPHLEIHPKR